MVNESLPRSSVENAMSQEDAPVGSRFSGEEYSRLEPVLGGRAVLERIRSAIFCGANWDQDRIARCRSLRPRNAMVFDLKHYHAGAEAAHLRRDAEYYGRDGQNTFFSRDAKNCVERCRDAMNSKLRLGF